MSSYQVVYQYQPRPETGDFHHSLFGCFNSCADCCFACLCPHCFAFVTSQDAGESCCTSLLNCLFYPLCICCLRANVRGQKGVEGGMLADACVSLCCPCCALVQLRRELRHHDNLTV